MFWLKYKKRQHWQFGWKSEQGRAIIVSKRNLYIGIWEKYISLVLKWIWMDVSQYRLVSVEKWPHFPLALSKWKITFAIEQVLFCVSFFFPFIMEPKKCICVAWAKSNWIRLCLYATFLNGKKKITFFSCVGFFLFFRFFFIYERPYFLL